MNQLEIRSTFLLAGVLALRMIGLFIVMPLFSLFARDYQDATPFMVGVALGIYGFIQALCHIPFGWLSDKIGRKKIVIFGLLLFILGSFIAMLSTHIMTLILGRALQGFGAIGGVTMAWLADETRSNVRAQAMAIVGLFIGIAFGLSLALGAFLASTVGFQGLFGVAMICGTISLLLLSIVRSPKSHISPMHPSSIRIGQNVYFYYISVLLQHAILAATFVIVPIILEEKHDLTSDMQWPYLSVVFLCSFLPLRFWTRKIDTTAQPFKWFAIAIAFIVAGQSGMAFLFHSLFLWLVFMCLFFIGFNCLEAGLPAMLSKITHQDYRGQVLGGYSTCQFLGIFLGASISGFLYGQLGLSAVSYVSVFVAVTWLGIMIMNKPSFEYKTLWSH